MSWTGRETLIAVVAVVVAVGAAMVLLRGEEPEPVAIVGVELGDDDRVDVVIDRCGSEPSLARTALDGARIVVEVIAKAGSGDDCQDRVEVAVVTNDVLQLVDATTGQLFSLRVVPERSNRPPGTRE